jgi:hypothetical protein
MLDASASCGSGTVGLVGAFTTGAHWPDEVDPRAGCRSFRTPVTLGPSRLRGVCNHWFQVLRELSVALRVEVLPAG